MSKNQEKIKTALNRIEDSLQAINTDKDWINFLCFQAQFYNYSFGNAMLIFSQNPNATYVKGYKAWNQLGRYVKKGSKGLAILAPCIRKVEVFKESENKNLYHDEEAEKEIEQKLKGDNESLSCVRKALYMPVRRNQNGKRGSCRIR